MSFSGYIYICSFFQLNVPKLTHYIVTIYELVGCLAHVMASDDDMAQTF